MKITLLSLDSNNLFLREMFIRNVDSFERLQGYSGEDLYAKAEREPNDPDELVDVINLHFLPRYKTNWADAAVYMFKALSRTVGGTERRNGQETTWKLT